MPTTAWMQCAEKASEVLNNYYSKKIKKSNTPNSLKKSLEKYEKKHPDKVISKQYDFKTNMEIKTDEPRCEKQNK